MDVDGDYGRSGAVAFSADSRLLSTGGGTGVVRFWNAETGERDGEEVVASAGWVYSIAFDASGRHFVTAGTDGTIRLFDVQRREQVGPPLPGLDNLAATAGFTPDGARVIVLFETGQGYAWDVAPEAWTAKACEVAGRDLTPEEWQQFLPDRPYSSTCGR